MPTSDYINRIASVLGPHRVFGAPYQENGITVIPAAKVRAGAGGGRGVRPGGPTDPGEESSALVDLDDDAPVEGEQGEGGGFGVTASPAGALLISGDKVRWKVPFDLTKVILGGQLVGVAFFAFAWLTERSKAKAAVKIAALAARSGS